MNSYKRKMAVIAMLVIMVLTMLPSAAQAGGSGITPVRRKITRTPVVRVIRTVRR